MTRIPAAQSAGVYDVAARFADRCLRRDGSLLAVGDRWTRAALEVLARRFDRRLETSTGDFAERWSTLLDRLPADVRSLAAEVMLVHVLVAADLTPSTKHRLVEQTLPPSARPFDPPADVAAALAAGVVPTGAAFKLTRLSQLRFLVRAAVAAKATPPRQRASMLRDASGAAAWLRTVPVDGGTPQREALKHLLLPDHFEAIVSVGVKQRIVRAFRTHVPAEVADVDDALAAVRAGLTPTHGARFTFADEDVAVTWR